MILLLCTMNNRASLRIQFPPPAPKTEARILWCTAVTAKPNCLGTHRYCPRLATTGANRNRTGLTMEKPQPQPYGNTDSDRHIRSNPPATCIEKGTTTYIATVEFEGKTYTSTEDVTDIPAVGHGEPKQ